MLCELNLVVVALLLFLKVVLALPGLAMLHQKIFSWLGSDHSEHNLYREHVEFVDVRTIHRMFNQLPPTFCASGVHRVNCSLKSHVDTHRTVSLNCVSFVPIRGDYSQSVF